MSKAGFPQRTSPSGLPQGFANLPDNAAVKALTAQLLAVEQDYAAMVLYAKGLEHDLTQQQDDPRLKLGKEEAVVALQFRNTVLNNNAPSVQQHQQPPLQASTSAAAPPAAAAAAGPPFAFAKSNPSPGQWTGASQSAPATNGNPFGQKQATAGGQQWQQPNNTAAPPAAAASAPPFGFYKSNPSPGQWTGASQWMGRSSNAFQTGPSNNTRTAGGNTSSSTTVPPAAAANTAAAAAASSSSTRSNPFGQKPQQVNATPGAADNKASFRSGSQQGAPAVSDNKQHASAPSNLLPKSSVTNPFAKFGAAAAESSSSAATSATPPTRSATASAAPSDASSSSSHLPPPSSASSPLPSAPAALAATKTAGVGGGSSSAVTSAAGGQVWRCSKCSKDKDLSGDHLARKTEIYSECWPCARKTLFKLSDRLAGDGRAVALVASRTQQQQL